MAPAPERFASYREFWPHYLAAHARPATRALHYLGTASLFAFLAVAVATALWWWLIAAVVVPYAFAWAAHFTTEGNRPATFGHPVWSLASDFRMCALALTGRLGVELARHGIHPPR